MPQSVRFFICYLVLSYDGKGLAIGWAHIEIILLHVCMILRLKISWAGKEKYSKTRKQQW
jgi:hypothetical protein